MRLMGGGRARSAAPASLPAALHWLAWLAAATLLVCGCGGSLVVHKYSTRVVRTKYGPLRGVIVHSHPPVEAFLGVPYATPPLGSLRYMPPVTPSTWRSTRLADRFSAVCPQRLPDIANRTEALLEYPRTRLLYLEKLLPLLANQSEDCLYMNLYVPRAVGDPFLQPQNAWIRMNVDDDVPMSENKLNKGQQLFETANFTQVKTCSYLSAGSSDDTSAPGGSAGGAGGSGAAGSGSGVTALPCIVYVHGESYEWNSGNPYDGTVLASYGHVIVVTINFRLGILGFLKTGAKGSAQGNFGLMDLVAGLHWLRENLPAFGGDPERITLMGHGTGAALANFIAVSPVAKELLHRAVLLSGSGLSPWALQRDPLMVKRRVAEQTDCHGDLVDDDLAPCLRTRPLQQLLGVHVDPPRFLPGFAPFIDGTVLLNPASVHPPPTLGSQSSNTVATSAGYELADFPERDLMFGLTSTESYLDLTSQDLLYGFNETRRDRILRTYVRNSYYYHLNEIFSTLKNEYTDWEKPMQNPLSVRDATLEVLSDGHTAAPLIRIGYLHTLRGGKTFFLHFLHQTDERDFPQRSGSVRGEDVPYVLGLPLVAGQPFFPHNYSHADVTVSRLLIHYIANFARKGDPNGNGPTASPSETSANAKGVPLEDGTHAPFWDTYDTINQLYLELGNKAEMKNHYRGHKMSLWLNLIPQLHRPGEGDDISMRHHHFQEEGAQYYDGSVRPQSMQKPTLVHVIGPPPPPTTFRPLATTTQPTPPPPKSDTALQATTTECPPNASLSSVSGKNNGNNLLRKLASSHYQSYTTALTVTIAVGCFLLLLNILIFAGIYHQRDRGRNSFGDKKKEELAEAGSCSSSSGETYESKSQFDSRKYDCKSSYELTRGGSFECKSSNFECKSSNFGGEYSYEKRSLAEQQLSELPLQEFKSSPPSGVKRLEAQLVRPPSYSSDVTTDNADEEKVTSPSIPEPPPPPKNQPPSGNNQTGILRSQTAPTTPGTMKKRVQIQEISV